MSHQASSWAQRQTAGGGGPKCLLLTLANHADKAGVCFPGRAMLAEECECRPETVTVNLAKLEQAGLLSRHQRRRRNGSRTSDWIVLGPRMVDRGEMVDASPDEYPGEISAASQRCSDRSGEESSGEVFRPGQVRFSGGPEKSEEKPESVPGDAGAKTAEQKPVAYRGKRVPRDTVEAAVRLLAVFCDVTGRRVSARTTAGEASPDLKQVIGALLERDAPAEDWERGIRAFAASPPDWVQMPWQVGAMFGTRSASWVIASGQQGPGGGNSRSADRSATVGRTTGRASKYDHVIESAT